MAHFAELDENNIVKRVIVVGNHDTVSDSFKDNYPTEATKEKLKAIKGKKVKINDIDTNWEDESKGVVFCNKLLGGTWIQTSYNNDIRFHYAGIGYKYDSVLDAFITPQPYPSWILDEDCNWQAPVPMPIDGKMYRWDEAKQDWVVIV